MLILLAAAIGALGVVQVQDHGSLKSIRNDNVAIHQQVDVHETRLNDHDARFTRHATAIKGLYKQTAPKPTSKALEGVVPVDSWMEGI